MLEFLGDAILSIVSGGATGLLGSVISGFTEFKKQQLIYSHEEKMAEIDIKTTQMEIDGAERIAGIEAESAISVADANALSESYKADAANYSSSKSSAWFVFVDVIRGLIRPALTLYLMAISTMIYLDLDALMAGEAYTASEAKIMVAQVINTLLYITTTVVLWWFGTRNKVKFPGMK